MNSLAIPNLTFLTSEQIQYVHVRSLEILGRTGVRVDSARARQIFADADGVRFLAEDRVALDAGLVEKAKRDDAALMEIGRRWISFFALGNVEAMPTREGAE